MPYTPDTYHLISAESIRLMERKPVLVDTSRGQLVDTPALVEALRSGAISGAGLDVLESAAQAPADLLALENVIVTPHMAWLAEENHWEVRPAVEDILRVLKGERPKNPVPELA